MTLHIWTVLVEREIINLAYITTYIWWPRLFTDVLWGKTMFVKNKCWAPERYIWTNSNNFNPLNTSNVVLLSKFPLSHFSIRYHHIIGSTDRESIILGELLPNINYNYHPFLLLLQLEHLKMLIEIVY